ncbi:Mrp/NBP35 family ATP-binding protein [Arcanobacterium urinimassiliense]|uniref:Mrp/NBP35 family ATP-binding protein n=1 Tax=Arcanobacterium urinimassiliense TaxID=1871014 RepID=UPI00093D7595|nr:P-loop NTPase [Arcanobacterium urinimassiliense]
MSLPTVEEITATLATVVDPEIHRPITEINMVGDIDINPAGVAKIEIRLTTAGCPLKDQISSEVKEKISALPGISQVEVVLTEMSAEQKADLRKKLRGGVAPKVIPFTRKENLTRVYAISSGKGGVGKSSVTVNLAAAMAKNGKKVGIVDADIYGFSIPQMMGVTTPPQVLEGMLIPPVAHGVKVISIGMFMEENTPVIWRGPILHRALEQFFADVHWGDLDVLFIDLPPGTGDVPISIAQLIPKSEIIVVTTPQTAAVEVAERAGLMAKQTQQRVVGVVENMSYLELPDNTRMPIFGSGGGKEVAEQLSSILEYKVPLLAEIPLEQALREGGDAGVPIAIQEESSPAQRALQEVAEQLGKRAHGLAGLSLGISPL